MLLVCLFYSTCNKAEECVTLKALSCLVWPCSMEHERSHNSPLNCSHYEDDEKVPFHHPCDFWFLVGFVALFSHLLLSDLM